MIPDKDGWWWYKAQWQDDDEKSVMMIHSSLSRKLSGRIPGFPIPINIDHPKIVWLGPVNPEPMKASGE